MAFKRKNPAELQKQLAELKGGNKGSFNEADGSEWKLKLDNAGNGNAVIRFLPPKTDDSLPFVKLITHGFQLKGNLKASWYIANCTATHGDFEGCPVCKYMNEKDLYNTDKDLYGAIKRNTSFWANILVVKDPAAPENEGKVFKYRFGVKIFDKINAMADVDVEMGESPVDVTCPFEGANFSLKVKKVSGFQNYDDCKFQKQTELTVFGDLETDEAYEKLTSQMYDLRELTKPEAFKSFEENDKNFKKAMSKVFASKPSASQQASNLESTIDSLDLDDEIDETERALQSMDSGSSSTDDESLDELLNF